MRFINWTFFYLFAKTDPLKKRWEKLERALGIHTYSFKVHWKRESELTARLDTHKNSSLRKRDGLYSSCDNNASWPTKIKSKESKN